MSYWVFQIIAYLCFQCLWKWQKGWKKFKGIYTKKICCGEVDKLEWIHSKTQGFQVNSRHGEEESEFFSLAEHLDAFFVVVCHWKDLDYIKSKAVRVNRYGLMLYVQLIFSYTVQWLRICGLWFYVYLEKEQMGRFGKLFLCL